MSPASNKVLDPVEDVDLDLDSLERPEDQKRKPFSFSLRGRRIVMADPQDQDWRDVIRMDNPVQLFRICLSDEDRTFFFEQEMEGWRLGKLVESFEKHYGLQEQLRKARQQQQLAEM